MFLIMVQDKQNKAKRGKQWGKHYSHFGTFLCTGLHYKNAETISGTAL